MKNNERGGNRYSFYYLSCIRVYGNRKDHLSKCNYVRDNGWYIFTSPHYGNVFGVYFDSCCVRFVDWGFNERISKKLRLYLRRTANE